MRFLDYYNTYSQDDMQHVAHHAGVRAQDTNFNRFDPIVIHRTKEWSAIKWSHFYLPKSVILAAQENDAVQTDTFYLCDKHSALGFIQSEENGIREQRSVDEAINRNRIFESFLRQKIKSESDFFLSEQYRQFIDEKTCLTQNESLLPIRRQCLSWYEEQRQGLLSLIHYFKSFKSQDEKIKMSFLLASWDISIIVDLLDTVQKNDSDMLVRLWVVYCFLSSYKNIIHSLAHQSPIEALVFDSQIGINFAKKIFANMPCSPNVILSGIPSGAIRLTLQKLLDTCANLHVFLSLFLKQGVIFKKDFLLNTQLQNFFRNVVLCLFERKYQVLIQTSLSFVEEMLSSFEHVFSRINRPSVAGKPMTFFMNDRAQKLMTEFKLVRDPLSRIDSEFKLKK